MKKYSKLTNTIRGAVKREGFSYKEFSQLIGMPEQTLLYRFRNPGTWRFYEWGAVLRHIPFKQEELQDIERELRK